MSIIYEALKKVEGQKKILPSEIIPQSITFPVERKEKKASKEKRMSLLSVVLLLVALAISALRFILPPQEQFQEQKIVAPLAANKEINPARVHRISDPKSQTPEEIIVKKEPVQEYILEGIIYDSKASLALINGRVINESGNLGGFRIDKISEDKVEMINIEDNRKVILSLSN